MIEVDGLTFHYPDGTAVFEGFTWHVAAGDAWAVVGDNVALGLRIRGFYGPDGRHAPAGEAVTARREITQAWLDRLGLAHVAGNFPGQISGGQRQRTAIAPKLARP